jgi:hypothetical protein
MIRHEAVIFKASWQGYTSHLQQLGRLFARYRYCICSFFLNKRVRYRAFALGNSSIVIMGKRYET